MENTKEFLISEIDRLWEECILVIHPEAKKEYQLTEANKETWHGYSTKNFGFMEDLNVFFWEGEAREARGWDDEIPKFQLIINIWDSYADTDREIPLTKGVPSEWRKKYIALLGLMLAKGFDDVLALSDDSGGPVSTLVEELEALVLRVKDGYEN